MGIQGQRYHNGFRDGTAKGEALLGLSAFPQGVDYVKRYQDPRQADTIMKVQQELDETQDRSRK